MANVVQIQIKVDNDQALPSISQLNNALDSVGLKGTASFKQAGAAAKEAGGHFTTSLDSVRLLSQEFGFRLPRAMESMLARIPAVTSALSRMLGVMASIAAAEVFVRVASQAYKLEQEYISLNAQADKFFETLKKTQQEDIANTRSLETTQRRLNDATKGSTTSQRAASVFHGNALGDLMQGNIGGAVIDLVQAHGLMKDATTNMSNVIKLGLVQLDQEHQRKLKAIDLAHAKDALLGIGSADANAQKQIQIAAENADYDKKKQGYYGNRVASDDGQIEQQMKIQQAKAEAAVKDTQLARKERDERIKAQNDAINAGLEGEAKYRAERDQAIDAISRKAKDSEIAPRTAAAITASLEEKYDNERQARLDKQILAAQQMVREAQQAGLAGGARIAAEHANAIERINNNRTLDPAAAGLERQAADIQAHNKMSALEDQFSDHVNSLAEGRVQSSLQAFAKIDAGAQKEVSDLKRLYDQDFANSEMTDDQKRQAAQNLQRGIQAIDAAAEQQRQQLRTRNQEEDLRYAQEATQAEARVRENGILGWTAEYQNGINEIQQMEQERLAKLQDDIQREGLSWQEAAQRQRDIVRSADAEIAQQNQQMQHRIAGALQEAFTNPAEFIKSQMEKMFFEIVAAWIMRMNIFKTVFGQTMGSLQPGAPGGSGGGGFGGILGSAGSVLQGIPGTRGIANGSPSISSIYAPASTIASQSGSSVGSSLGTISSVAGTIGGLNPGSTSSSASWDPLLKNAQDVGSAAEGSTISRISGAGKTMGTLAGIGMGGYQLYQSTTNAFETGSPLKGAMGDAAAGATLGMVAGPLGAAIGAAVGAGVGAAAGLLGMVGGEAGRLQARNYYKQTVRPQLEAEANNGSADFQSAISDVGNTAGNAYAYMASKFGRSSANWVKRHYLDKEASAIIAQLTRTAEGGRMYTQRSAMQFHGGGTITGFGSLGTSANEGFIHAMLDETVMNPRASVAHGPTLHAMNAGASAGEIAAMYLAQTQPSMPSGSGGGDTHHWTIHALDAHSFTQFLKRGGAQQIVKHTNEFKSQYAGDGISG